MRQRKGNFIGQRGRHYLQGKRLNGAARPGNINSGGGAHVGLRQYAPYLWGLKKKKSRKRERKTERPRLAAVSGRSELLRYNHNEK